MRIVSLPVMLLALSTVGTAQTAAASQTAPNSKSAPQKSSPSPPTPAATTGPGGSKGPAASAKADVAPDTPVITIVGLCPPGGSPPCVTTVSKAEFESVIRALAPDMPAQARPRFANEYVQALTVASEGQKMGVDKEPIFAEQVKLARIQILARGGARKIQEDSKPTPQQVEAYYKENGNRFEEISLRRILVPKPTGADAKPDEAKALADKIRVRAAAGEDPDKLEAEAYSTLKTPGTPPPTNLGARRHSSIDPRFEKQISALTTGQVTGVLEEPQGYSIYKVEGKRIVPMETVQKDIETALQRQHFEEKMKQLLGNVKTEFNENYFGPSEPQPGTPVAPPSLQSRPATPPKK